MSTLRTRRGLVPLTAERVIETHIESVNHGRLVWEVRIAPELPMDLIPFELRSTMVSSDLTAALSAAISNIDDWFEDFNLPPLLPSNLEFMAVLIHGATSHSNPDEA